MLLNAAEEKSLADRACVGLEDTPAAQASCDLSDEDLAAIDLAYHDKKVSGALDRQRQQRAVEDQVQDMRCKGAL